MNKRRIAIVGSRTFPLPKMILDTLEPDAQELALERGKEIVTQFVELLVPNEHVVLSGGARGVDRWAQEAAEARDIEVVVFRPDWKKYGKSAGFKRNKEIVLGATIRGGFVDSGVVLEDGTIREDLGTGEMHYRTITIPGADDVVAFWDGQSRGTLHTIKLAHKAQKPYVIFGPDGQVKTAVTEEMYAGAVMEVHPEPVLGERPIQHAEPLEWEKPQGTPRFELIRGGGE